LHGTCGWSESFFTIYELYEHNMCFLLLVMICDLTPRTHNITVHPVAHREPHWAERAFATWWSRGFVGWWPNWSFRTSMFVKLETLFCDVAPRDVADFSHSSSLGVPVNVRMCFFAVSIVVNDRDKHASWVFSVTVYRCRLRRSSWRSLFVSWLDVTWLKADIFRWSSLPNSIM
jgi:hypothetical protein